MVGTSVALGKREPTMSLLYGTVGGCWISKVVGSNLSRRKGMGRASSSLLMSSGSVIVELCAR